MGGYLFFGFFHPYSRGQFSPQITANVYLNVSLAGTRGSCDPALVMSCLTCT